MSTLGWEFYFRKHVFRAPANRFPRPCVVEECDLSNITRYLRSDSANDQRTRTFLYKAKGKYMRIYKDEYRTYSHLSHFSPHSHQHLETNLYLRLVHSISTNLESSIPQLSIPPTSSCWVISPTLFFVSSGAERSTLPELFIVGMIF